MASNDFVDSASFRDPSGHVYRIDGRIYRTVTDRALDDFEALRASGDRNYYVSIRLEDMPPGDFLNCLG